MNYSLIVCVIIVNCEYWYWASILLLSYSKYVWVCSVRDTSYVYIWNLFERKGCDVQNSNTSNPWQNNDNNDMSAYIDSWAMRACPTMFIELLRWIKVKHWCALALTHAALNVIDWMNSNANSVYSIHSIKNCIFNSYSKFRKPHTANLIFESICHELVLFLNQYFSEQ